MIFLFCLCTLVWGVESCSGAGLQRTMWESEEETVRVVFSPQFLLQLQKRLSLYRPLHVSTSSISADALEREPAQVQNSSVMRTSTSRIWWIYKPLTHRINVEN